MLTFTSHHQLLSIGPSSQSELQRCCLSPISDDDEKEKEGPVILVVFLLYQVRVVSGDLGRHLL